MGAQQILEKVAAGHLKDDMPRFDIGDTINVHCRIVEGDKERIQVFSGTLISRKGRGVNEMITVRRIVDGQGVERIFPIHSPRVAKYEVVRRADARRAKLYFLRDRTGKKRRLRDRRRGMQHVEGMATLQ
ncbi:MAG: 50S ribosomal protein L19 [Phycisphaerales bacterium]